MAETYQALYRKWRPLIFEDVVGQDHVSETLKNSIASGRIAHAYLFCGTRGTGKTSSAKIFSRAVNCTNSKDGNPCNECDTCRGIMDGSILDVYEMDAASNSGIDNIREIRDEVIYSPIDSKYKVYIIDEAHMLTIDSFNALLKTLEEPPGHVIFILATTEPHKIPATIHSRCQRFDFRRINIDDITKRLNKIVKEENISITPDAVELIAELADGSMRDGLSILDQCAAHSGGELRYDNIIDIVGVADRRALFTVAECVADKNTKDALLMVDEMLKKGKEVQNLFEELIMHFRTLMICKSSDNPTELIEKTEEITEKYKNQSDKFQIDALLYIISQLSEYLFQAKKMSIPKVALEMAIVSICSSSDSGVLSELAEKIKRLERDIAEIKSGATEISSAPRAKSVAKENKTKETAISAAASHLENSVKWDKWSDALNLIKKESKSLYTFLFNASALYFGDEIEIVLTSDLAYEKINTPEGKKYLADLFTKVQSAALKVVVSKKGNLKHRDGTENLIADLVAKKDLLGDKMKIIEE